MDQAGWGAAWPPGNGAASPNAAPWGKVGTARVVGTPSGTPPAPSHRTLAPVTSPVPIIEQAHQTAIARIQFRFPGVHTRWGQHTNHWWAYVPTQRGGRLLEAVTLETLVALIGQSRSGDAQQWRKPPQTN